MVRPPLPIKHANPQIKSIDSSALPPVKYQTLDRDGQEVLVGRMKIPTPNGHAFILRRFDTGAISLTTMFRAAFPNASENEEKKEVAWIREHYDLTGTNGSTKEPNIIRLAGTWVDPEVASTFAESYAIGSIIALLAKSQPDPNGTYRRSSKATPKASATAPPPSKSLPSPSPTIATPNPPKRRKESSPTPSIPAPAPALSFTPAKIISPPRRSTRTKSPASSRGSVSISSVLTPAKPTRKTPRKEDPAVTPGGSDETAVDEDAEVADAAGPDMHQDIAEQKEMIEHLKAQREAALGPDGSEALKQKRAREEEDTPLQFEFKEPEVGDRTIATNRRIFQMEPRRKSLAWGALAFAAGLGAITFLPNYFF